jgi:hypothetical protein
MTIYLEWTDVGIDERAVSFDASLIRDAVARVVTIWPDET